MPDGESDFDKELNAILNPEADTATPAQETQTQSQEAAKLKYGGREWENPEKLGKAYEALHKDYTRKSQEYAKFKQYGDLDQYLTKNPELRTKMNALVQEYNARRNAGQSEATAQKQMGMSPEVVERVERMEAFFEDQKLEREIDTLKSSYKLDQDDVKLVLHKATELAEKGVVLPLKDVFKILAFEERNLASRKEGEKEAIAKISGKRKANVGGSDLPTATPSAKPINEMKGAEYDKALNDKLSELGYSG